MKKYFAVWGALFFFVICVSLYLMLETISSSPARLPNVDPESIAVFEQKIDDIQKDIELNHKTIKEIRELLKRVAVEDTEKVAKLQDMLSQQNNKLKQDSSKLDSFQKQVDGKDHRGMIVPVEMGGVDKPNSNAKSVRPMNPVGSLDQTDDVKYDPKTWGEKYARLHESVTVSDQMCSWAKDASSQSEIQMHKLTDSLPFDNPDGGAWKQGWNVTYPANQWHANSPLKVFVVPHSHNDPGWVKTFEDYYLQQTKHILDLALQKLQQFPDMKFIYAEISFFHMWWNEQSIENRNKAKELVRDGRLEIVTGGWVMNDEANTHYFAMLDQLLEGHQWLDGTLGAKPTAGWAIDPFGHTPTMAYLLRRSGLQGMLLQRVHYAIKKHFARNKQLEFMWRQGWDKEGTTDILAHMMPFYSYDIPHTCGPEPAICCQFDFRRLPGSSYSCPWHIPPVPITQQNAAERAGKIIDQWKKKASLYRSKSLFIPLGDDFRYDKPEEWDQQYTNYKAIFQYLQKNPDLGVQAQFGTLSDYFNSLFSDFNVKPGHKPDTYPTLSGDFFTYADKDDHYWSGYFTSRPFQKNLDRVIESHQRGAEILFSLATAQARKQGHKNFPQENFMDRLINARRNLGLFQHHDGITGTAKDFVVVDYGNRLLSAMRDLKILIKECATYLTLDDKTEYAFSENAAIFNVDESRVSHDSLPEKSLLGLGEVNDAARPVLFYNSLAQSRDQIVKIYVDTPSVLVKDNLGQPILSQVEPFWASENEISGSKFKISFRVSVPALGIVRYTVQRVHPGSNTRHVPASILIFNSEHAHQIKSSVFSVEKMQGTDITLENPYLSAMFSGSDGMLQSVTTKADGVKHKMKLEFVTYGTKVHSGDRSGAYLFLPDGPATPLSNGPPPVHITKGPIVSEIKVYFDVVTHVVRLYNSSGIDGVSLDIQNVVDITSKHNMEIAVRVTSDIDNKDKVFYTDMNGFQMQLHKTLDKLTLQGNVKPMPTMAFIEDSKHRLSVLSANSLGFSNLNPGVVEVMLDRRLNQDDSRGLGQGVLDSKKTPSRFKLLLEERVDGTLNKDKPTAFASLLGHRSSLELIHPIHVIPHHPQSTSFPKQTATFTPMSVELPCDVHLVNLRTMQNADDGATRLVPKDSAALFLHRQGTDCSYPNHGLVCNNANGQVTLGSLFSEVKIKSAQQVSLTLMYSEKNVETEDTLDIEPMEIDSYVVTLN